jgi:hypothetical protein
VRENVPTEEGQINSESRLVEKKPNTDGPYSLGFPDDDEQPFVVSLKKKNGDVLKIIHGVANIEFYKVADSNSSRINVKIYTGPAFEKNIQLEVNGMTCCKDNDKEQPYESEWNKFKNLIPKVSTEKIEDTTTHILGIGRRRKFK